jgi:hypothetical protein
VLPSDVKEYDKQISNDNIDDEAFLFANDADEDIFHSLIKQN